MKIKTEYWSFSVFPTFIKATPTTKNKYADGIRIYSSGDAFLSDFDRDDIAEKLVTFFEENKTTNKKPMRRCYLTNK